MFSHILGFRLETNLRKRGIDGLEKASFRFFDLNPSGQIRKIIDDNAAQTHQVVAHMIPDSSQAIITPVLVLALGFIVSIRVGIILLALTIIGGLILGAMMGEQEFMKIYQESLSKLSAETVEYVRGMQVVKIFKANVESFKSFYKAIKDYSKYAYDYSLSCKRPYVLYQWLFFGLIAILIIPIVYFMTSLASAKVILLELIMILFLSGVLFVSFMRMMWYSMYISQGNYAVDTLEALYEDMQKDKLVHGNINNFKKYNIEFENVSFAYNDKAVIENLSFNLEEGKSYALVGSSGSGKSTVAKLISGFYNVNKGSIKIGGIAISEYSDEALIKAISFVF
ncbi:ABC transporter ATP-binding protein/permease, partial [Streptococcus pneumoniae]|nr:ABC transporter ATP-binding protein/permease [Streptococcus pneumoniae]